MRVLIMLFSIVTLIGIGTLKKGKETNLERIVRDNLDIKQINYEKEKPQFLPFAGGDGMGKSC